MTSGNLFTHSLFRLCGFSSSFAYYPNSISASVLLDLSTIAWCLCSSVLPRLIFTLCFFINCVTEPMTSLTGSTCNNSGYFNFRLYLFSNAFSTYLLYFEVSDSASLYLMAISTTVNAY